MISIAPPLVVSTFVLAAASAADPPQDVRKKGAFGFPQEKATVVHNGPELRVSVWNDAAHLFVQSVIWKDDDGSLGETDDGREIGDWSNLRLDVDADGKPTANRDRNYMLNPWPKSPGLRYSVVLSASATSGIRGDTKGRGGIQYIDADGKKVRIDTLLIPLAEIGRKPGDKIRFAYWASSEKPKLTLNSVGFDGKGRRYYPFSLPFDKFHELTLADRPASIDVDAAPNGQTDSVPLATKAPKPKPKVGATPPEVSAKDWLNTEKGPTLAGLHGKVVVVEFWATWCGPCVAGIPHLNKLHEKHAADGLVILSFTDQSKQGIETFSKTTPMKYILGCGSNLAAEYGVTGIPHAFLVGKDGKIRWEGNPGRNDFDKEVAAALAAK